MLLLRLLVLLLHLLLVMCLQRGAIPTQCLLLLSLLLLLLLPLLSLLLLLLLLVLLLQLLLPLHVMLCCTIPPFWDRTVASFKPLILIGSVSLFSLLSALFPLLS